jgi:cell wall-associated NlpC family hydrolase
VARQASRAARADARRTQWILIQRVRSAFLNAGSSLDLLLGSATYGQFAGRVEFLDQIAQADAEAVALAQVAGQRSVWTASQLASAVAERRRAVDDLARKRAAVEAAVAEHEGRVAQYEAGVAEHEARVAQYEARVTELAEQLRIALIPPAPVEPPPEETAQPEPTEEPTGEPTEEAVEEAVEEGVEEAVEVEPVEQPAPNPAPPPPAPSSRVAAVLEAAYSQVGVPWVFAGDSPDEGFDCSGFTMWSWAHGGVSLPHSSAMQYDVLPHVDRSELQPGDLLFFYSPIHHVAIYVGGGRMIHSPGSGRTVTEQSVYWEYYTGAARPG